MKVLFLEIHHERAWAVSSIGPAFIASYVRKHGHEVDLFHVDYDLSTDDLLKVIAERAPDLIAVSLTSRQWQRAKTMMAAIREKIDIPVITGGLHPTFAPENTLEQPGFDYVCLGEGEEALVDVLEFMSRGEPILADSIKNIQVKGGKRPQLRPPYDPIDELPFMARDMMGEQYGVTHMITQRGCPFPCTYCAARKFHDLYKGVGSYGRRRSHENVLAEIRHLKATQIVTWITFLDDTFTLAPSWVKEFCRQYGDEFKIPFSLHARAETVNPKMLKVLAEAGCKHITYGVESGSNRVRREVMKRVITNQKLIDVFKQTRDEGIIVTANYILGIPGETYEEAEETMALHKLLEPDDFGYFVFYPYPGTSLFHTCRAKGYLPEDYWRMPANHRESVLTLPDLSKEQIGALYDRWTVIRQTDYLQKHGATLTQKQRQAALDVHQQSANWG